MSTSQSHDGHPTLTRALRAGIRDVPDFPHAGILFKDITPALADPELFSRTTAAMAEPFASDRITHVAFAGEADTLVHSTVSLGGMVQEPWLPGSRAAPLRDRLVAVRRLEER